MKATSSSPTRGCSDTHLKPSCLETDIWMTVVSLWSLMLKSVIYQQQSDGVAESPVSAAFHAPVIVQKVSMFQPDSPVLTVSSLFFAIMEEDHRSLAADKKSILRVLLRSSAPWTNWNFHYSILHSHVGGNIIPDPLPVLLPDPYPSLRTENVVVHIGWKWFLTSGHQNLELNSHWKS